MSNWFVVEVTRAAIVSGVLVGFFFGIGLEKSKMYLPQLIRTQMLFTTFQMLKVFLTATAVGMVIMSVLEHFGIRTRTTKAIALGFGMFKGYGSHVAGGLILGAGISLAGACPGTVLAQLGTGVASAKYVFTGALLGGFCFPYFHNYVSQKIPRFHSKADSKLLDRAMGFPYWVVALAFASVLLLFVFVVEYLHPWTQDVHPFVRSVDNSNFLQAQAWPPIIAGLVIGSLQLPALLFMHHALGASGSYVTLTAWIAPIVDINYKKNAPYFLSHQSYGDYAQLSSMFGVLLGSFFSNTISGGVPIHDNSVSPLVYFVGGFLLIFGGRLAGGCASGHGISGIARLSLASVITVASMFAGGISTANLMYISGYHP